MAQTALSPGRSIRNVLVLGAGSAGLITALALRRRFPDLDVRLLHSETIGVIGVGEGTIGGFHEFFFGYLGLDIGDFHRQAEPTWKLGLRLNFGPRSHFNYVFDQQCDWRWNDQALANGFYCRDDFADVSLSSALMDRSRAFLRDANGAPILGRAAFHLRNDRFVSYLEGVARSIGVKFLSGTVAEVAPGPEGVAALQLESGERLDADLYVDASGFASKLLGQTLEEPFVDFASTLFCDRALVGTTPRDSEPIQPYTTADTLDAGWCWRIDHEHSISRGYVYASSFIDDAAAEQELLAHAPGLDDLRLLQFRSGHRRRSWVGNVVGVGNAFGFVEPLEATAIQVSCNQARWLCETLSDSGLRTNPALVGLYNEAAAGHQRSVRRILGLHYRLNTRSDSDFWTACRNDVDLAGGQEILDVYQATGPALHRLTDLVPNHDLFGLDGYLTMFIGMRIPYPSELEPDPDDARRFERRRRHHAGLASQALTSEEALAAIRSPDWVWPTA